MLTASELAAKITEESGRLVTVFTIYKWTRRGLMGQKLPHTRIGGYAYYDWDAYVEWQEEVNRIKDQKQPAPRHQRWRRKAIA